MKKSTFSLAQAGARAYAYARAHTRAPASARVRARAPVFWPVSERARTAQRLPMPHECSAAPLKMISDFQTESPPFCARANASKLRWRATATPGWSTRLACCFRRLAGNTARRLRKHTGFPNLCVFKSACRSQTHARRVSAASRRRQHASRVLHPEASARRHCVLMRQPCAIPFPATRLAQPLLSRQVKFLQIS